ncbi:S-adenosyl-l-methionine hydroxide adenosyltransferase family protein [Actinomycetaceae bacterium TAE3-ERU4]|nr:S-adenosyl-l-methionine hydroxide adenosyltransferase family protein [Actinomycetaceae bacterium TAE3-ERU4]
MKPLVLQSDFGISDGAVSAMYGVALGVNNNLGVYDLTHDIPPYNIWDASYRLTQTIRYWPEGSVFVSVVDPGVGTDRLSVVCETESGHYIVTPDNGTLTHVDHFVGIKQARIIDEEVNRLPFSGESYTFHGRDVYAYTGARLAAGIIDFSGVGPTTSVENLVRLPMEPATKDGNRLSGIIDAHDVRYGSLWTNITLEQFRELGIPNGSRVKVSISHQDRLIYSNLVTTAHSFAEVGIGEPLVYANSLSNMALAINRGSFAQAYNISSGQSWKISLEAI